MKKPLYKGHGDCDTCVFAEPFMNGKRVSTTTWGCRIGGLRDRGSHSSCNIMTERFWPAKNGTVNFERAYIKKDTPLGKRVKKILEEEK